MMKKSLSRSFYSCMFSYITLDRYIDTHSMLLQNRYWLFKEKVKKTS